MSLSAIPESIRHEVFHGDAGVCRYCRLAQVGQASLFHVNHIVPRSRGGRTETSNLVLQCPYCSMHKSNKITAIDPLNGELVKLFHPLQQQWPEHFVIIPNGECNGATAIGRATAAVLRMNDPLPPVARALQIRLDLLAIP